MPFNHFVNDGLQEFQEANRNPIEGYQDLLVLTLEEAIEKITPPIWRVMDHVWTAKKKCNRKSKLLTWDESAAIYLYSMPTPLSSCLNSALRAKNRHALKPWFAFLKLFITALEKLPSINNRIWRGVSSDVSSIFADGDVHIWWSVNSCSMDLRVVGQYLSDTGTVFAIDTIRGKNISAFSAFPEEREIVLMPGTHVRAQGLPLNIESRFFIVHLEEENLQSDSQSEPNHLFEVIREKYLENAFIERIMNPAKTVPMEQSYINLAVVESRQQQEKEKKLHETQFSEAILSTFDEIYGAKTSIDVKNIFEKCRDHRKQVLIFGRAGIGKTTFCQYVTFQWATGAIWQQYRLIVFIRLRSLTESRYPPLAPGTNYSPLDLVKKEYFYQGLAEKDERLLEEQLKKSEVLWLLDGYDEIIQNVPTHLEYLFEQLLETPHHILTSRPYLNTLSYNVQLEIIGFTDDNIKEYVKQFFDQIKNETANAPLEGQRLLSFLKRNPRIWGIAHIPVNLELICSLWCDTDWSETTTLTMTAVYDKMIEWLCRRHLEKQNISSSQMTKDDVSEKCRKELLFLESLAFNGMENKSIILPPKLIRKAFKESQCSPQHQPHLLNIGILKSLDYQPIGTRIEADKNHYFVHLSFQEHFAARYLVRALNDAENQKKKASDFIRTHKYNQRFQLMFTFTSGLLNNSGSKLCMNSFWEALLSDPIDLVGFRHVQLLISCIDETECEDSFPRFHESLNLIIKWIKYSVSKQHEYVYKHIVPSLRKSQFLVNQTSVLDTLVTLHQSKDPSVRRYVYWLISHLPISNSRLDLIHLYRTALNDMNAEVRRSACKILGRMGEKGLVSEVINSLVIVLGDPNSFVRWSAGEVLRRTVEKATTNEVINKLLIALGSTNNFVRQSACEVFGRMSEKAATSEVINKLLIALTDTNNIVRRSTYEVLGKLGEKAATSEVINKLLIALDDTDDLVRQSACEALSNMSKKAATTKVINRLVVALGDVDYFVRCSAYEALANMGKKTARSEVINKLLIVLHDTNDIVRQNACKALGNMGEKAATNEVINKLLIALDDTDDIVRQNACEALGNMGGKAATTEVINRLLKAHEDTDDIVRQNACEVLGNMGGKAATTEVINRLLKALEDANDFVRRNASKALGNMSKKEARSEVINKLLIALDETNDIVRQNVCKALGNMGEKAATNEVVNKLLIALDDTDDIVRQSACEALNSMGGKAVTNEVINRLLKALNDANHFVRRSACAVLGNMDEKVGSNEVIDKLLIALDDTDNIVRQNACTALGNMGEKAARSEVINRLLDTYGEDMRSLQEVASRLVRKMLTLSPCMSDLKHNDVMALSRYVSRFRWNPLEEVSAEQCIKAFFDTKILLWLSIIKQILIQRGYAFTVTGNTIVLYGSKEPVEILFTNRELCQQLQDYFDNWLDELF